MKVPTKILFSAFLCVMAVSVIACSHAAYNNGGGGGGGGSTGPFTVAGTVTGLTGTGLILQNNGVDLLTVSGSSFTFKTAIVKGGSYSVAVNQSPTNPSQTCTVAGGSGTANANVTNVTVTCTTGTTAIGVTVAGLTGTGLVLQDTLQAGAPDLLTITGSTTSTQFKTALPYGQTYNVTVSTQPTSPPQTCTVTNGTGTAASGVAVNIQVTCSLGTISIGGSVSGFSGGSGFALLNNGGDKLTVTKNGTFTFPTLVPVNSAYKITVGTQPSGPNQVCTVTNGTGNAAVNVTNISVVCPAVFHPIDVNVIGVLGSSGSMVLINEGGDNLNTPKNGAYTFATPIAHGSNYDVQILVASGTQTAPCIEWGWTGIAVSTPVNPIPLIDCGHDDWTWMIGSNQVDQFGTLPAPPPPPPAVPPPPPKCPPPFPYTPGGSEYSATWTDQTGKLWLLTGIGLSSANPPLSKQPGYFDELWVYNPASYSGSCANIWTQIEPDASASAGPSGRWGAITWTDPATGDLMLFGGQDGGLEFLNDVWRYNIAGDTWTQISGGANQPGTYPAAAPGAGYPGGRWAASGRLDSTGTLWVFGGIGCDSVVVANPLDHCSNVLLNDLWKYSGGVWTWVSGSSTGNQSGSYGVQGTASAGNVPPSRQAAAAWIDNSNNFWMFGGFTTGTNGFNDLWKFNTTTNQWTWMNGSTGAVSTVGSYGTQGVAAASNVPGARWLSAAWSDVHGNLWLFGGEGFDTSGNGFLGDLWEYTTDPAATSDPGNPAQVVTGQWVWVRGFNSVSQPGVYGVAPDPAVWPHVTNNPGTRWAPSYWTVKHPSLGYEFFMFSGEGFDATGANGSYNLLNDVWRYLPYP